AEYHLDRLIKFLQRFFLGGPRRVRKFQRTISLITSSHNLRADVVIQVSREMQHEVAEAVAEWKGFKPKLLVAQRSRQLAKHARQFLVTRGQRRCNCGFQIRHSSPL